MKQRILYFILFACLFAVNANAQCTKYYVQTSTPWGMTYNQTAMNAEFGSGNWTQANFATSAATIFASTSCFVMLEGSDGNATALNNFLIANLTLIENWVASGGRLFINAAPNVGGNINYGFGGTLLNYGPSYSSAASAANVNNPIFLGPFLPTVTTWTGSIGHAIVTGTGLTDVIYCNNGVPVNSKVLCNKTWGSGVVFFGGMVQPGFWGPVPQVNNIWNNIFHYVATYPLLGISASLPATSYCGGATPSVTYTSTGITFNTGNTFTVQLSSSTGSFTTPTTIGSITSTTASGTIPVTIPTGIAGTGYRIRVVSTNTVYTGETSGTNISISNIALSSTSHVNVACFGANTGSATIAVAGGTGSYSYLWMPGGATTATANNLTAANYTVTVTDVNAPGCQVTQTHNITQPATALTVTPGIPTHVSCFGGSNGSASVSASGGTTPYTYLWTPGIITGNGTNTITGLNAGTRTITVTDGNGCTNTQNITINQPTLLVASSGGQINLLCNGASTGTATVNATGGTPGYTYLWSNGQTTQTATGLVAGTYTATVTDTKGCTATQSFTLTQPSALTVQASSQVDIACFGGTGSASVTIVGGTGTIGYNWTPGNPPGDGTPNVTGLTPGTWTVTATDANNCSVAQVYNFVQPALLTVTPNTPTNVSCNGGNNGTASVTVTGGTGTKTYNWTPGNPVGEGTNSVSQLTAGVWTVSVTDANLCAATQTISVTQPTAIVTSSGGQTNVNCYGATTGTATVNATGGTGTYTYLWSNGQTTQTATGLAAGVYTVTVKDANLCPATFTFTITQPAALLTATAVSQTNVFCNGGATGAANVNVTGGAGTYSYNWTPGNPPGDGTASVTDLTAGVWTITVTDGNLCTATQTFNITQSSGLTTSVSGQVNVSCFGGNNGLATVNVSGGTGPGTYTYAWVPGTGNASTVSGLSANTYTVTVTDGNNCSTTQNVVITQPVVLTATQSQVNVSCNGFNNATATVTPAGGTTPYTYQWFPSGGTAATATGLAPGNYNVVVTDFKGCTVTKNYTITQPATLVATAGTQVNVSCNGGSNATATVNVTGGTTPYTYLWAPNGGTGATGIGMNAGTKTVTVTDAHSCVTTQTFTITQPAVLTIAATQTNVSCFNGNNATATATPAGGTAPYTYLWNNTQTTATATALTAGTYSVTVTDAHGCTATQSYTITQPTLLVASSSAQTNVGCNGGNNGSATVAGIGGTGAYTYSWAPSGGTAATASGLTAGTYTATVTDANNCSATHVFTITEPAVLVLTPSQVNVNCNGNNNGTATATMTGGTTPYNYTWTPSGGNAATASGLAPGTYTVNVTDAHSCAATQSYTITEPATLTIEMSNDIVCPGATLHLTSDIAGGTTPYTISWTGANIFTSSLEDPTITNVTAAAEGNYTVSVTDALGCTASDMENVAMNHVAVVTVEPVATSACVNSSAGFAVTATGTGLTYHWRANGTYISNGGVYSGTTSNMLSISDVIGLNNVTYDVVVSGTCNTDTSVGVMLTTPTFSTWTGTVDSAWSNPMNWACNDVPTINIDVIIPSSAPHMPLIDIPGAEAHSINIGAAGSLAFVGIGNKVEVKGDIFDNSNTFDASLGTVMLSGNGPQAIPGSTYKELQITGGDIKQLQSNATITNGLTLTDGYLSIGDNNLTMAVTATITGGSDQSFVITDGLGSIITQNMGSGGNTSARLFPVGTEAGVYLPAIITNTGTQDNFSVRVINDVYNDYNNNIPSGAAVTENFVDKTWIIGESTNGGSNANITLSWTGAEELTGFSNIECMISHFNENTTQWELAPEGIATNNAGRFTYSRPNVSAFSPFSVRTVIDPNGIKTVTPQLAYGLVLYPNPVSEDKVYIRMNDQALATDMDIAVMDITGKVVSRQHYAAGSYRADAIEMTIGDIAPGAYTLRLKQDGATAQTAKFIRK
jgi:hypothetical protein